MYDFHVKTHNLCQNMHMIVAWKILQYKNIVIQFSFSFQIVVLASP